MTYHVKHAVSLLRNFFPANHASGLSWEHVERLLQVRGCLEEFILLYETRRIKMAPRKRVREQEDRYCISGNSASFGLKADRRIYFSRHGRATGLPLAILRDGGMESACNQLVADANRGARRRSIYDRRKS